MNYTGIEDDIVARLAPLVTAGYEVEAMPNNEASNIPPKQRGRVTIQVGMSKFNDHRSLSSAVVQEEDIYIDIILRARTLRATGGIYDLCELSRRLLIGFTPDNCRLPLSGVDFGGISPSEMQDSLWTYALRLKTQTISVGAADEDVTPLITAITFDDQTTTAPPPSAELFASAYNVETSGDSVILAWITSGGDEVSISGIGVVNAIGSATVSVADDVIYTITVTSGITVITQDVELTVGSTCADASVTVNSTPFGTAPSGGSLEVPVVNGGSNPVGTIQAGQVVIANNATFINGVQVTDQEAEIDANIAVELDGNPSGSWNAMTQTWEVNSSPCADANLEINGVQQETIASGGTFNLIATLDGVAGGSYNAGTNTLSFTSNTGWIRPSEWPAFPSTLTAADERFYGVVAVFENAYNQVGIEITNLAANIDWGDGTSVVSNGATRVKVYDYTTLAATVYQWPDGRNVKYVLIDITRVGGALARVVFYNTTTINAQGGNNFVDVYCSLPNTDTFVLSGEVASGVKPMALCQRVRVLAVKSGAGNFFQGMIRGMRSLRVLELPYSTLGQWNTLTNGAGQVDDLGDIDWGTNTSMASAFASTGAKRHGNLTANSATTGIGGYMTDAVRLEEFGNITATSATTLAGFFGSTLGSPMLTTVGTINAPLCQNISSMFFRCAAFTGTSFTSCANIVNTNSAFTLCASLYWMEMFGLTRGVSFAATAMGNYGMNLFANSIGTATGAQTITVTGTPFGALLTALDATALAIRLVMTGKGYTVAN